MTRDHFVRIDGKRKFITLAKVDVEQPFIRAFGQVWPVSGFIGRVLEQDVGKRVYLIGDILQVENNEQRDTRGNDEIVTRAAPRWAWNVIDKAANDTATATDWQERESISRAFKAIIKASEEAA